MYGELKTVKYDINRSLELRQDVRLGIRNWSQNNVYVPPSILYIPHNLYQTTGSTSELFAELFILLYVSVQIHSFDCL